MPADDDNVDSADPAPPILSYQRHANSPLVTVRTFYSAMDGQMYANELDDAGIPCTLANENTNVLGAYAAFSQVELQVRQEDAEEAGRLLSQLDLKSTDVEPEGDVDPSTAIPDPSGEGVLITVAAFDNSGAMFDAAALLEASRVECFLPALTPRGERPAGTGKRFAVRVRETELGRAQEVLAVESGQSGEDSDEPRCPKCGSWRTYSVPAPSGGFFGFLLGREAEASGQIECLRCHHRWVEQGSGDVTARDS